MTTIPPISRADPLPSTPISQPSCLSSIAKKVKAFFTSIFGYLLRICFFMLGEIKTCGASSIMRFYNFCSSDPHPEPFDPERVNRSRAILEAMGGEEKILKTPDGLAEIRYMLLTYDAFKQKVNSAGGHISDITKDGRPIRVLIPPYRPTPLWQEFLSSLEKMNWPKLDLNGREGFLLSETPTYSDSCVLNIHTARRTYAMDRKYISKHLGAGISVCGYDARGIHESTGTASEGGHYLDAKTVVEALHHTHGYPIHKIWATGSCGGGPMVAFLKKEYHKQGINIVLQNTFTSLSATIRNQPFPASLIGRLGIDAVQSQDPETCALVEQDHFNTLQKLESLPPYEGPGGVSMVLYATKDTTLAPEEGARLSAAAEKIGKTYTMVRDTPAGQDGHINDPTEEPAIWKKYIEIIS